MPFILLFKLLYKIIDKLIVTPISRLIYKINEFLKDNSGRFEKILNRPNILIYISLICAVGIFLLVDSKVINLTEKEAEIITDQKVNVIYNEEAYVVEGVPETVDITLIGSKSTIYLATQLGEHEVVLDLSKYSAGTYKVKLKYNNSVESVNYTLDPSTVTVKISEKVRESKSLTYDIVNQDKLDSKLNISDVKLDTSEIYAMSSQEILNKVASVKALVDASQIDIKESGTVTLDDVPIVAYDASGNKIDHVEFAPSKVTATLTIDSYHATKPVKIRTNGSMNNGKAIASITSSVKEVTVYGEKSIIDSIDSINAYIQVDGLDSNKTVSVNLEKPNGVRYMSDLTTNISVTIGDEVQKTISGVQVRGINSGDYVASAVSAEDSAIDVIVKSVQSVIDSGIDASNIEAYVDLTGLKPGTHTVKVNVSVDDERVTVQPSKTEVNVKIVQK